MDWHNLINLETVELSLDDLYSVPVLPKVQQILGSKLILKSPIKHEAGDIVRPVVSSSGLFHEMSVTASFSAAAIRRLNLNAVTTTEAWTLSQAFPDLQYTLASALQFKEARWSLVVDPNAVNPITLKFTGTLDTNSSLGFLLFLVGREDEVFSGAVEIDEQGIPTMRLASQERAPAKLDFLSLNPIKLTLVTDSVPAPISKSLVSSNARPQSKYAAVRMELSTSILFKREPKLNSATDASASATVALPLKASIFSGSSMIRMDADTSAVGEVGLHELSALLNKVPLNLDFGEEFKLEKWVNLQQLTCIVDPESPTVLTNAAFTVGSAGTWDILKDNDGNTLLTLEAISVAVGISAPFGASDVSASLRGAIKISTAHIIIEATISGSNVTLHGYLEPESPLSLKDIAIRLLGSKVDSHTPALCFRNFDLLVEPNSRYELHATLDDLWTISITEKAKLHIESVSVHWKYKVGDKPDADAKLCGKFRLADVVIELEAKYQTSEGWIFSGGLASGQSIHISDLLDDIFHYFQLELPSFVEDITLDTLWIDLFNPTKKSFHFTIGGKFKVDDDKSIKVKIQTKIEQAEKGFKLELKGWIAVGKLNFEMHFKHDDPTANSFVASYLPASAAGVVEREEKPDPKQSNSIHLKEFITENLSESIGDLVPDNLKIDIKDVFFGFTSRVENKKTHTKFLLALDLNASANLSKLPLVGQAFPADQTVSVEDLRLVVVGPDGLTQKELESLNSLLPGEIKKLTVPAEAETPPTDNTIVLPKGLAVSAVMNFGGVQHPLSLPVKPERSGESQLNPKSENSPVPTTSSDDAKWFALQKTFGPVSLEKVGVMYKDGHIWFLLNASLSAAGLTLTLDGLAVHSPVKKFELNFDLRGLGIVYKGSGIEIGGALLRIPKPASQPYDEYAGAALIKTKQLTISAIGSFVKMDTDMSLFVYATLDYPIGGPSFFFVTGLAAGFGYNRNLIVPEVDKVAEFPLVADAVNGDKGPIDIRQKLASINKLVPVMVGQYFLAVGIKFTSFKVVDSFALLTVTFGRRFELNVLGLSTLVMPTPVGPTANATPLARVQLAVKATYIPDEGFLGVSAQLTAESFILSKDCHLTGGFAFYSWFSGEHSGDFVLSLGGYHPDYKPPAHYPKVPRLGFDWRVTEQLHIKGAGYYAMTPATLMAGGSLQATWESTNLKVWFKLEAHFIITWQPYHYDARLYVDIGVSYTFNFLGTQHINVNVGADLHLWGPEFSGTAHIQLWVISFDITFGAGASKTAEKIDWTTFKGSFLPANDQVCTLTIKDGLINTIKGGENGPIQWVVNPKEFSVVTNSTIPITKAQTEKFNENGARQRTDLMKPYAPGDAPGIAPMDVGVYEATHFIKITKASLAAVEKTEPAEDLFEFTPVQKRVPVGIWGRSFKPSMSDQPFIENTVAGFEIRPKDKFQAGPTAQLELGAMVYSCEQGGSFKWEANFNWSGSPIKDTDKLKIEAAVTATKNNELLTELGMQTKRAFSSTFRVKLLNTPQGGTLA